jgi:Tol biopolymer transport system component
LWIVPTDGGEPFAFRKTWATYNPRWAPSGNRIGFIAAIGPPRIWTVEVDPESGRPIDPPRMLIRTNANAFAFSPDGERIALVSSRATAAGRSEIHIVDWESRRSRVLLRESGTIYWLDWAPDAESIYYGVIPTDSSGEATHRVVRAHARTGSSENVLEVEEFLGLSSDGARLAYRPAGEQHADHSVVELATTAGEILVQLLMPARPTARWGAGLGSLFQTRVAGMKTEIWEFSY